MASPFKQPAATKKGGGWGSLLSGAVAGLESRLDTILANEEALNDEPNGSARQPNAASRPDSASASLAPPKPRAVTRSRSREGSRTRPNDRLAERLAKATAVKTPTSGSAVPSRTATPDNERSSVDGRVSVDEGARTVPDTVETTAVTEVNTATAPESTDIDGRPTESGVAPVTTSRASAESSRPSTEVIRDDTSSRPSAELPNGSVSAAISSKNATEYEAELHTYMEKIDALQAKLTYLANSTVAAAKAANASPDTNGTEKQLAKKDEQIALLMEEGEKLSKTELRHLQTIKKLRSQTAENDKVAVEARKKLEKTESELRQRLRKAEQAERASSERNKVIAGIEREVEELRVDRENATALVKSLTGQLTEAKERAERAEREAKDKSTNEVDRGRIAALENDVEDAQLEKKFVEERAAAEIRKVKEKLESEVQQSSVRELEMKGEISGLESRLEAMRARAEDQGVDTGAGETNVQLLRQVETLQRQYALAKENWEAIEASLNGRVLGLERERDEAGRREAEARKKVRDVGQRSRAMEDELEERSKGSRRMEEEVDTQRAAMAALQESLTEMRRVNEDQKAEAEKQKRLYEVQMQQRGEEQRTRGQAIQHAGLRNHSPAMQSQKISTADTPTRRPGPGHRLTSHDLAALHTEATRPTSRHSSNVPVLRHVSTHHERSSEVSPSVSRQESALSLTTPSFEVNQYDTPQFPDAETPHTPDDAPTLADLLSTSTAPAAGPSVQLVERMSLLVRRLESEKAASKDELMRLSSQRDSARDEVVALMREVEVKRDAEGKAGKAEGELGVLRQRYEASLEMLGEREEECEELRQDVRELKRLYRELVEGKMGGGGS